MAVRNADLQVRLFLNRGILISPGALHLHLKYKKYWVSCNRMEKELPSCMEETLKFHT